MKVNGQLTCGENIADLGGLKLAYRALQQMKQRQQQQGQQQSSANVGAAINGFSPEQRLFLAWSQVWRGNITEERAKQLVTIDPHGPNTFRCNGTLSNIQEFFEAFEITEGRMFKAAEERVDIW